MFNFWNAFQTYVIPSYVILNVSSSYASIPYASFRTPVSYTHLDVYKRQTKIKDNITVTIVTTNKRIRGRYQECRKVSARKFPKEVGLERK